MVIIEFLLNLGADHSAVEEGEEARKSRPRRTIGRTHGRRIGGGEVRAHKWVKRDTFDVRC